METKSTRESRRRKILERGADRLALITGRPQNLPSHPLNSNQHPPPSDLFDQTAASSRNGDDGRFGSTLSNKDSTVKAGHGESIIEPPLSTFEASRETSRASVLDEGSTEQSVLDEKSTISTSGTPQNLESSKHLSRFVTASQISSAITASERSRLICSAVIALFVVLSSLGFPVIGSNSAKSIVSCRPVYLLLLTNATLVLARLLLNNQKAYARTVPGEISLMGNDWVEQAGKALEVGLVMQKAIDAVLMDCSVYTIIIIVGFSFIK
ncbi:uncharacterized protein LOC126671257 [Mercurialis annua]|uniref:uncharacterized protein LOC126671257 n=1 Tax=Mercurialis annua TaxID=3986 RepID=UPI002160ABB9|nr:uncharacterized protein LOC126671257 [Mercurialis annua]